MTAHTSASKMDDSFHYFSQLPPELRLMIWEHCLPYRIIEEGIADLLLGGNESCQACRSQSTTDRHTQPPVITSVNSEAREFALAQGKWLVLKEAKISWLSISEERETIPAYLTETSVWVQPRRDVLHLNWSWKDYNYLSRYNRDPHSPFYMFLWRAQTLGMQPSIVAETIYPFVFKGVLDDTDPYELDWLLGRSSALENSEVSNFVRCLDFHGRLDIAIAAVSLHITKEEALNSGLFGLLGDAPVQMININDQARLREFHALFIKHALEKKEPAVQILFELFASSRFQTAIQEWEKRAQWVILAKMWDSARTKNLDILADPGSAWVPYLSDHNSLDMDQYLPNDNHPWVKQAMQLMPKLRPRIMVRHCTDECYMKDAPPRDYLLF